MKAREILHGLALVMQSIATISPNPVTRAEAGAAAILVSLLERMLEGRTTEQATAILKTLLVGGVQPITQNELDHHAAAIVAEIERKRDT